VAHPWAILGITRSSKAYITRKRFRLDVCSIGQQRRAWAMDGSGNDRFDNLEPVAYHQHEHPFMGRYGTNFVLSAILPGGRLAVNRMESNKPKSTA
jgi:hypothetical protein